MNTPMPEPRVREATGEDVPLIFRFINELAVYEKLAHEVETDEEQLEKTLFGPDPRAYALVCEIDGDPAGFALYFYNYSTWLGKYGIYLEDLYVSPEHRGRGAGKALLTHIAGIAVEKDCGRFEWSVLDWNTPSIEFYKSLGAREMEEWRIYRVTGNALKKLGNGL